MFSPGIHVSYLHQLTNYFVSGIEANISFNTNQTITLNCDCPFNPDVSDCSLFKDQWQSSIKGRGGRILSWNKTTFLPYLTTGLSFVNVDLAYKNEGDGYYSKNMNEGGWLIGTGIEWSLK